jgi:hypothetical protein
MRGRSWQKDDWNDVCVVDDDDEDEAATSLALLFSSKQIQQTKSTAKDHAEVEPPSKEGGAIPTRTIGAFEHLVSTIVARHHLVCGRRRRGGHACIPL